MPRKRTSPICDREAVYRTKEILCDLSDKLRSKILMEKDPEELAHFQSIYDAIPNAQFVIGVALAAQSKVFFKEPR